MTVKTDPEIDTRLRRTTTHPGTAALRDAAARRAVTSANATTETPTAEAGIMTRGPIARHTTTAEEATTSERESLTRIWTALRLGDPTTATMGATAAVTEIATATCGTVIMTVTATDIPTNDPAMAAARPTVRAEQTKADSTVSSGKVSPTNVAPLIAG